MRELKDFKQDFQSASLAYYWAAHTGFDVWTELANQKIFEYHLDKILRAVLQSIHCYT
jgi:hypothetical protein